MLAAFPLVFRGAMVRAMRARAKSQTRRPLDTPVAAWLLGDPAVVEAVGPAVVRALLTGGPAAIPEELREGISPRERRWLWVRERWRFTSERTGVAVHPPYEYAADFDGVRDTGVWRSPIHMPRSASRLTLLASRLRVQELHELSDADAEAEGAPWSGGAAIAPEDGRWHSGTWFAFRKVWDDIHGRRAARRWAANPRVLALDFDVCEGNVDRVAVAPDSAMPAMRAAAS